MENELRIESPCSPYICVFTCVHVSIKKKDDKMKSLDFNLSIKIGLTLQANTIKRTTAWAGSVISEGIL